MTHDTSTETSYMTVAEVAGELRLAKMTVYRMCNTGVLPSIRTGPSGRTIRIPRDGFQRYTAGLKGYRPPVQVGPGQMSI